MGYSHGKKWTEQEIIEKIQYLVKTLGIKTFPTHAQMNEFYNSCALSNAISKRGGTKKYADLPDKALWQVYFRVGFKCLCRKTNN